MRAIIPGDDDDKDSIRTRMIALCVGIVHGVAGPGGVLGVIPAVKLHSWPLAILYLATFCLTSIVTMGCFARCYGGVTKKISDSTDLEYKIELLSSAFSIVIGVLWITLLYLGILDEVFG